MSEQPLLVVTGGRGQLGRELVRSCPEGWRVAAPGSDEMDITDAAAVRRYIKARRPAVVVNAAAYTAVDRAEIEPARAWAVNADGAANVAAAANDSETRLIHISTDFVFDGRQGVPYPPEAEPGPLNEYGRSKLAGEERVSAAQGDRATILRTAWLYAAGGPNFVLTMLRLFRERGHVRVVTDQLGTPTWARGLAVALWRAASLPDFRGTHHWTDAGVASWYDFAVAIAEESEARGLLSDPVRVEPIRAAEYPTPARRPASSVLDKTSAWALLGTPPHWRAQLREMLAEFARG
jgi:dTDP-4-dehydrorhamnose reductase